MSATTIKQHGLLGEEMPPPAAVRCISLWQPWATLVSTGHKSIETRSWPTSYRGKLAIHAAKKWDKEMCEMCQTWPFYDALPGPDPDALPRGCIVALATLKYCWQVAPFLEDQIRERLDRAYRDETFSEYMWGDYRAGRWMWILEDVRAINPVPCRGMQGLFTVPADVLEMLPA